MTMANTSSSQDDNRAEYRWRFAESVRAASVLMDQRRRMPRQAKRGFDADTPSGSKASSGCVTGGGANATERG
jgi:hypothetical protein